MSDAPQKLGLAAGARSAWRGFKTVLEAPDVKKTYVQLALAIFGVATVLDVAGIWTILHFTAIDGDAAWWVVAWYWLLRIVGIGIILLAAPIIAMFLVNALAPLLAERVFFAGMSTVAPERAVELGKIEGTPFFTSIGDNLIRLLLYVGLSLLTFVLSFIPVVGSVGGPVLQGYFTARALSWELLDPYFEKLHMRFDAQHQYVKANRLPMLGFGLPFSLVMAIPLVGPLVYGLAQAAAGVFVAEVLEQPQAPPA